MVAGRPEQNRHEAADSQQQGFDMQAGQRVPEGLALGKEFCRERRPLEPEELLHLRECNQHGNAAGEATHDRYRNETDEPAQAKCAHGDHQ
jgi:hypothetical protein